MSIKKPFAIFVIGKGQLSLSDEPLVVYNLIILTFDINELGVINWSLAMNISSYIMYGFFPLMFRKVIMV
jgi:hypothetical protein